jgi:hypothetical protein
MCIAHQFRTVFWHRHRTRIHLSYPSGVPFLGTIVENFCQVRVSEYRSCVGGPISNFECLVYFGC